MALLLIFAKNLCDHSEGNSKTELALQNDTLYHAINRQNGELHTSDVVEPEGTLEPVCAENNLQRTVFFRENLGVSWGDTVTQTPTVA